MSVNLLQLASVFVLLAQLIDVLRNRQNSDIFPGSFSTFFSKTRRYRQIVLLLPTASFSLFFFNVETAAFILRMSKFIFSFCCFRSSEKIPIVRILQFKEQYLFQRLIYFLTLIGRVASTCLKYYTTFTQAGMYMYVYIVHQFLCYVQ